MVHAVQKAPIPKDQKKFLSFLGLAMFYEKILPVRADKIKPLHDSCKNSKFEYTNEYAKAFDWLKSQITSDRVLVLYDPQLPLVLA